jgi:DNA-binding MltR family transcriptional regulator
MSKPPGGPDDDDDDDDDDDTEKMLARIFSKGRFGLRHLKHSERGAALSAVAAIDRVLKDLLLAGLVDDRWSEKMLFGATSPLGSVGAKAHLAFLLGLISKELRNDLLTLTNIRNRFAHFEEAETFEDEVIAEELDKLRSFKVENTIDQLSTLTTDPDLLRQYKEQLTGGFAFEYNVNAIMRVLQQAAKRRLSSNQNREDATT